MSYQIYIVAFKTTNHQNQDHCHRRKFCEPSCLHVLENLLRHYINVSDRYRCNNSEVPVEPLGRFEILLVVTHVADFGADCLVGIAVRDVLGTNVVKAGGCILKS